MPSRAVPMPEQKNIATQLSVLNSTLASGPPNLTSLYLPKASHSIIPKQIKVAQI